MAKNEKSGAARTSESGTREILRHIKKVAKAKQTLAAIAGTKVAVDALDAEIKKYVSIAHQLLDKELAAALKGE